MYIFNFTNLKNYFDVFSFSGCFMDYHNLGFWIFVDFSFSKGAWWRGRLICNLIHILQAIQMTQSYNASANDLYKYAYTTTVCMQLCALHGLLVCIMYCIYIFCFQVSFSQCLGVIGYSVLPLIVTAMALTVFHSFYILNNIIKVEHYKICMALNKLVFMVQMIIVSHFLS